MAGIGIGPREFAVLAIAEAGERARQVEAVLQPWLAAAGRGLAPALTRVLGRPLHPVAGTWVARRGGAPAEVHVTFLPEGAPERGLPFVALAVTREHLHARVGARGPAAGLEGMRRAVEREAATLARRGKPFRRLRSYDGWDHEELPELAPAGSVAFWREVAEGLAPRAAAQGSTELGIAWPREEARSLALGDLLGAYRDLAPIFKLLAAGGEATPSAPPGASAPGPEGEPKPGPAAASPPARPGGLRR
jgi:hypothetical protein